MLSNCEPGPWQNEPDRLLWYDAATGLVCLIERDPITGVLCGYVGLPPGHPYYGVTLDELDGRPFNRGGDKSKRPALPPPVRVHGGVTYSALSDRDGICRVPGEPDDLWWLGFDCRHIGDRIPTLRPMHGVEAVYRDFSYVRRECEWLASQLAAPACPVIFAS